MQYALDIRKFEIELYWKRATYFWAFISATLAGYFLLLSSKNDPDLDLLFLLNCLGLVLSISWFLVNKGSKYWQTNWEKHVDLLEDEIIGPLYKTTLDKSELKWYRLSKEYGYSVSKINQLLSFYFVIIWILLALRTFFTLIGVFEPFRGYNITYNRLLARWL